MSVAEWALKPHPPFFRLTKRNSAKELSQKSMRSQGPFSPAPPLVSPAKGDAVDFSPTFNDLSTDFSNV